MSTPHPFRTAADTVDANITDGDITETLLASEIEYTVIALGATEDMGDRDFSTGSVPNAIAYGKTGYLYFYNADDTTSVDDGSTVLVTADGRRYILADMSAAAIASVLAIDNDPPASPTDGDAYVVDVSPTGAWVGHAKDIALYTPRGWVFLAPKVGCALLDQETGENIQYSAAGSWGAMSTSIDASGVAPQQLLFPMGLSVEAQQNAPPGSPVAGDGLFYLVGTSPSGTWSGHANDIATYDATSTWVFLDAYAGALIYNKASSAQLVWNATSGVWAPPSPIAATCQGRLTTVTATPITTTDQTAKATIYFTPFRGNGLALYVNGAWALRTLSEISLSLSGYTSGKPYDIFVYDSSGTPTLESLVWTNETTRATALAYQDSILVKSGDATRRYLGTIYTTATGQTEDSLLKRNVWNYYNRAPRPMRRQDTTASWTYNNTTDRQARASALNQLEFVLGVSEDAVRASLIVSVNSSSGLALPGIGLDGTTAATDMIYTEYGGSTFTGYVGANLETFIAAGRHTLVWTERSNSGASTITTFGPQSGMTGIVWG